MKRIQKTYLPGTAIAFMLTILLSALLNIFTGSGKENYGYYVYVFQLFGFLVAIEGIDYLLSFINFKSYIQYFLTELIILYAFLLGIGFLFGWIEWNPMSVILSTLLFLIIYSFIHWHFYRLYTLEADYINELIEKRRHEA